MNSTTALAKIVPAVGVAEIVRQMNNTTGIAKIAPALGVAEIVRQMNNTTGIAKIAPAVGVAEIVRQMNNTTGIAKLAPAVGVADIVTRMNNTTGLAKLAPAVGFAEMVSRIYSTTGLVKLAPRRSYRNGEPDVQHHRRRQAVRIKFATCQGGTEEMNRTDDHEKPLFEANAQLISNALPDYWLDFDPAGDIVTNCTRDGGKRLRRMIAEVQKRGVSTFDGIDVKRR